MPCTGTAVTVSVLAAAPDGHDQRLAAIILQDCADLLGGGDLRVTHGEDKIPFLQAAILCGTRTVLRQSHHQRAVCKQLDAHGLAQRDQRPLSGGGPNQLKTQ